jgi:hypothetical protein
MGRWRDDVENVPTNQCNGIGVGYRLQSAKQLYEEKSNRIGGETVDKIFISVLPDGTIKTDCDKISQPSHQNAEAFLRDVGRLAGGKVEKKHKHGAAWHTHDHKNEQHH